MTDIDFEQLEKWIQTYNKNNDEKQKKQLLTIIVMNCELLVKKIAYGLARRSDDPVEDITQVANIGLIKAVKRYNSEYKNLKTFLSYAIVGEIKHYLRDKTSLVKPPREILELSYRINKLSVENIEAEGEKYNETIAKSLDTTKEKVQEAIERRHVISLDQIQFTNDEDSKAYGENLADEQTDFKEYKVILDEAIEKLPEKLQMIIKSYYFEEVPQVDIAKILNTSQSNVSRMQKRAIRLLFDIITKKGK